MLALNSRHLKPTFILPSFSAVKLCVTSVTTRTGQLTAIHVIRGKYQIYFDIEEKKP
jgi:hypothetical protein